MRHWLAMNWLGFGYLALTWGGLLLVCLAKCQGHG